MGDVKPNYKKMADAIRALSMDAVEKAQSGHPGMPMGMADVATVLFSQFLKFNPEKPGWPDRDRFVLSAGHGSMLLYSLLYLTGYKDMTLEELKNFRQMGAKTAGHPEYGHAEGIETTTGPLGQGIANAVGMALAEKMLAARFPEAVDHHTYVILGDGCLMEGISHEAASLAGHLGLSKLVALFDDNGISIDGPTTLSVSDDHLKRFESYGWEVQSINGHDPFAITEAIAKAKASPKPSFIACKTNIGHGSPKKAGTAAAHGSPLGAEEVAASRKNLNWESAPFEIPAEILSAWREAGKRCLAEYKEWEARKKPEGFAEALKAEIPQGLLATLKKRLSEEGKSLETRKASQAVLEELTAKIPFLAGGSADLTGSNGTKAGGMKPVSRGDFSGNYIHWGVREHAMAAAMNGMALHGGFIPYGGTFLVFTDYMRPSIRLAALMKQRVIFVGTHDSIGLGEDGPTHQPVEHLASLRAIPGLCTFRPMDAVETLECWEAALSLSGPSVMALTRQAVPAFRKTYEAENLSARGAYVLIPAKNPKVSIFASGSEVEIAAEAAALLAKEGIEAEVVSAPCMELFARQSESYRKEVAGKPTLKVAIEAGIRMGWDGIIGSSGIFVGMESFGASGPYQELYRHFGIAPENIVKKVKKAL